jgi:DNA processing protein
MPLSTLQILALQQLKGVGSKTILKYGDRFKAENVTDDALLNALSDKIKEKNSDSLSQIFTLAGRIMDQSDKLGIHAVSYYEESFPETLRSTVNSDGKSDPPVLIFYKGDLSLVNKKCIAVIGKRDCSEDAKNTAYHLSRLLSEKEVCIVSGLAEGCDTYAHIGALKGKNGKTIAVLAHGLDTVFPPNNKSLADGILNEGGLLISEYPIGTPATKYTFVARDRLQAGLSRAALVVETLVDGGSYYVARANLATDKPLITLQWSYEGGRENYFPEGNRDLSQKGAKVLTVQKCEANYVENCRIIEELAERTPSAEKTLFD